MHAYPHHLHPCARHRTRKHLDAPPTTTINLLQVGFYQISKILVTPTVMALNYLAFGKDTSWETKKSVAVMLVGVTLATVSDVDVKLAGFLIGMVAVLGAAQSQILIGDMQKRLEASANQVGVQYCVVFQCLSAPPLARLHTTHAHTF